MIIPLTSNVQIQCGEGGSNWVLAERRKGTHKGADVEVWDPIGYYGRPDQALRRALQVVTFDRSIDKIALAGLVRRLEAAEKRIVDAIAAIDRSSYEAMVAPREKRKVDSAELSKRDVRRVERVMAARGGKRK